MKLLMCRPDYFGIEYEINPWMRIQNKVNHEAALEQWNFLYKTLQFCGAEIELVPPVPGIPDLTFTANAGLLFHGKIILAHFKYKERQQETPYDQAWFEKAGYSLLNLPGVDQNQFPFEGAGDALFAGDQLFAAYGFRTDRQFYEQVPYLNHKQLIYCELTNPYFYHLDTCFCPLNAQTAIWYPDAFTQETQKRMAKHIELLNVNEAEAQRFACNAVVLKNKIVLPTGCPKITIELEKRGFTVFPCKMDEYLKAGGACKCLTLQI